MQSQALNMTDELHLSNCNESRNFNFVPAFAFDDEKLRHVLRARAWRYVHQCKPCPANWDYAAINSAATKKAKSGYEIDADAPDIQHENHEKHIAAINRAGGYMEIQAAIAFKSWRLGMPSPDVATDLGMSPWQVRQILRRLRAVAARLGYEVGKRHHSLRANTYSPSNGWSA